MKSPIVWKNQLLKLLVSLSISESAKLQYDIQCLNFITEYHKSQPLKVYLICVYETLLAEALRADAADLGKIDNKEINWVIIFSAGKNCSLQFLHICSQSQAQLVLNELQSWFDKKKSLKKVKTCHFQFVLHVIYRNKILCIFACCCPLRQQCWVRIRESVESCWCYCCLGLWKRWSTSSSGRYADLHTA